MNDRNPEQIATLLLAKSPLPREALPELRVQGIRLAVEEHLRRLGIELATHPMAGHYDVRLQPGAIAEEDWQAFDTDPLQDQHYAMATILWLRLVLPALAEQNEEGRFRDRRHAQIKEPYITQQAIEVEYKELFGSLLELRGVLSTLVNRHFIRRDRGRLHAGPRLWTQINAAEMEAFLHREAALVHMRDRVMELEDDVLAPQVAAILEYAKKRRDPGITRGEVAHFLGIEALEASRLLKQMKLDLGLLFTQGERSKTRYFPVEDLDGEEE